MQEIMCKQNYDISEKSHVKIGGIFDKVYFPRTRKELAELIRCLHEQDKEYFILGNLSNVLIREGRITTIGISLRYLKEIEFKDGKVIVGSGVLMPSLAMILIKKGYIGFDGLVGIPGSVGGGIYMNASSYGSCMSDYIESVDYIDDEGNSHTMNKAECHFIWRESIFHHEPFKDAVIVGCVLSNLDKSSDKALDGVNEIKLLRGTYQEKKFPNLGSTFSTRNIYKDIFGENVKDNVVEKCIRLISRFSKDRHKCYSSLIRKYVVYSRKLPKSLEYNISEYTLNCFVNKGISFEDFVENIKNFRQLTGIKTELEIEIIDDIK